MYKKDTLYHKLDTPQIETKLERQTLCLKLLRMNIFAEDVHAIISMASMLAKYHPDIMQTPIEIAKLKQRQQPYYIKPSHELKTFLQQANIADITITRAFEILTDELYRTFDESDFDAIYEKENQRTWENMLNTAIYAMRSNLDDMRLNINKLIDAIDCDDPTADINNIDRLWDDLMDNTSRWKSQNFHANMYSPLAFMP